MSLTSTVPAAVPSFFRKLDRRSSVVRAEEQPVHVREVKPEGWSRALPREDVP